jgi:bacterioferritin-associated ferredoxin
VVVCLCKGVSDSTIRDLIVDQGLTSVKQVMASCKAGSDCGTCICHVKELLERLKGRKGDEPQSA